MKKSIKAVFTVIDDDKLDKPIFRRIGDVSSSGKKEAA